MKRVISLALLSGQLYVLSSVALAPPAHAYIDPGTMGMVMQVIVAGVAGGLFFLNRGAAQTKAFFKGLFKKTKSKK